MRMSAAVRLGCVAAVLVWGALPTAGRTVEDPAPDQRLEQAARQLGDPSPAVRDAAAATLRAAGAAAEPALRAVGESGDPEAARRARGLLRELRQPAPVEPPDVPPVEITAYRKADRAAKLEIIEQFGGGYRAGVLARLWAEEPDGELRHAMFRSMLQAPAASATALVAHGNAPAAERLLEAALAARDSEAADAYAALALLRGRLDDAVANWSARTVTKEEDAATIGAVRAALRRAAGNPAAAVADARLTGDAAIVEQALLAADDWHGLAEAVRARPDPVRFPRQLGLLAGALHLASDAQGFDEVARRMTRMADAESAEDVAHVLLLAGRVEPALQHLADHGRDVLRFQILAAQDRHEAAFELMRSKDGARDEHALWLRVVAAEQLYGLGDDKGGAALLERVAKENETVGSRHVYALLGDAARRMKLTERAWDHYLAAVKLEATHEGEPSWSVSKAFGDEDAGIDGNALWAVLAARFPDDSPEQQFGRARAVVERTIPLAELKGLADAKDNAEDADAPAEAEAEVDSDGEVPYAAHLSRAVAQRIKDAGDEAAAVKYLEAAAVKAPQPEYAARLYGRLGDWSAAREAWAEAATWYGRAWNADRTRSAPLYLRGWAMAKAGWNTRAGELMNLAHLLPLADGARRLEAIRVLEERNLPAEMAREAAVVLRTARPGTFPADVAQRHAAELAVRANDHLAAATAFERSMLNFMNAFDFADPIAYVRVPHTIRRNRAKGLLAKGDVGGAEREIAAARAGMPGDVMLAIDVVPEFERLGKKTRADELYAEAAAAQEAVLAKYPDSASHHNSLAWLAVNCGRDADKALAHARRAAALRPDSASVIDTLAEVQFRRGDIDAAIASMRRCVELEPTTPRHREQIERFEAAKRGEKRPMPPG